MAGEQRFCDHIKQMIQGIPVNVQERYIENGFRQANGTWTGSLGRIQRGELDAWVTYASMNIERWNDFAMTQPYGFGTSGILMRRPTSFGVNFDAVSAGFSYNVFLLLFCVFLSLFILFWINEKRHYSQQSVYINPIWALIRTLIPGENTEKLLRH